MSRRRKSNCSREGNSPGQYTGTIQTYFTRPLSENVAPKPLSVTSAVNFAEESWRNAKSETLGLCAVLCACNTTRIDPSCQPLRVSLTPSRD
jgi:hypothetical protein